MGDTVYDLLIRELLINEANRPVGRLNREKVKYVNCEAQAESAAFIMDELSEEDKLAVNRARKVQRYFSQSFSVAEQFTGYEGKYVPLKETLRGFKMILNGECDDIPESCFLYAGTIDEVLEKAKANQ